MKACVIQPPYSTDYSLSEEMFQWEMASLDQCDESMDLIVLPEFSDVPCLTRTLEEFLGSYQRFNQLLLEKVAQTAVRCHAVICVNALYPTENGLRNTTHVFDKLGNVVGRYYKQHLTAGEVTKRKLDGEYSFEFEPPTVITVDGVRYGFLTCYDFYFYEMFANMARQNLDVIIGCSHQRSDRTEVLELINRFLAYNCNAYVVRASVSMDEQSDIGGGSMIVGPDGRVLADLGNRAGMTTAEFDPRKKYLKPMGFGNQDGMHHQYIEIGRRPWKYRPAGSAIVRFDSLMPYPRTCACGGLAMADKGPEYTMAAFGAAVGMGADEIAFTVRLSGDGEFMVVTDPYPEGAVSLEKVLRVFACHVIMNIHVACDNDSAAHHQEMADRLIGLIRKYDGEKHVYLTSGNKGFLQQVRACAQNFRLCLAAGSSDPEAAIDQAIAMNCAKVQLDKESVTCELMEKAHAHGLICNVASVENEEEAAQCLKMGVDTILTHHYDPIAKVVKQ